MKMKWYEGNIPSAITQCRNQSQIFVVYISGSDELSKKMDDSWNNDVVSQLCSQHCTALKLKALSEECVQFSAIYPVVCVPSTYFIGVDGSPLDIIAGHHEPEALAEKLKTVIQKHENQTKSPSSSQSNATPPVQQATSPNASQPTQPSTSPETSPPNSQSSNAEVSGASGESVISKEEKVQRARELIEKKQAQKAQSEKDKEKNEELARRQLGKDVQKLKQQQDEQERKEAASTWKKEREEDRLARERVKEQIARDRAERKQAYEKEKAEREEQKQEKLRAKAEAQAAEQARSDAIKRESARLQFRLPDGSSITETFPSSEPLSIPLAFLRTRVGDAYGDFTFMQTYPRREFTESDLGVSLLDLNLAPSAALILVARSSSRTTGRSVAQSEGGGIIALLMLPFTLLAWLGNLIIGLFSSSAPSSSSSAASTAKSSSQQSENAAAFSSQTAQQGDRQNIQPRPGLRSRQEGNIRRFTNTMDDDEDMNTYNGNSTQQM